MTEAPKSSQFRIAFALVCGLAMCCAVMYITADGNEDILEDAVATAGGSELKTESWDVKKVGTIITDDTPDGRTTLLAYFEKVEKEIANEVAGRKADIESIKIQMAKNRAYNKKARDSMKKMLLQRMAVNAAKAKKDLNDSMSQVARDFAAAAKLENERNKETRARSRATRKIMKANKAAQTKALKLAVLNQQRSLAALDASTNARIAKTNKNIAANAAQIKANALKARQDLDHAMDDFDKKMYNVNEEAQKGRSKLAAEAKTMDKKVRAMINGKVKAITASTAKQFSDVRQKMADDRAHADAMLAQTSTRMMSLLNAKRALQDARFKQTVADIAATKKEADEKIHEMKKNFKVQIYALSSKVKHDVSKLNQRVSTLQGVVTSNKLEQAKVNKAVDDEIKNMIKVGNDREAAISKSDKALHALMEKNRADNEAQMTSMSEQFFTEIGKIRAQMAKDRKYQEGRLGKATNGLYQTLAKNQAAQDQVNKELTAATKAAADEAARNLEEAKHDFSTRLGALSTTVQENDKKANAKIEELTGVVAENAQKDAEGRKMLAEMSKANALELKSAVRDAVAKGEKRARQIEKMAKNMNKKTRDAMNAKITTEIGTLTKQIHSDIEGLRLQTKEARAQMKEQILLALREEEELLKKQLGDTVKWANGKFVELEKQLAETETEGAAGRAALKASADEEKALAKQAIVDAVEAQAKALLATKFELREEIKKTNTKVDAYGAQVQQWGEDVKAQMAANVASMKAKLEAAKKAADEHLSEADAASIANHKHAIETIEESLDEAKAAEEAKFDQLYIKMGEDRAHQEESLASAVRDLNDKLAKHSALEDARFSKTVKDLAAAKKEAWDEVQDARTDFKMSLNTITANVKNIESRIVGEIGITAGLVIEEKAYQLRVNQEVEKEMTRVLELSDVYNTENKNARGQIREIMNKNKAAAAQEVKDLAKSSETAIAKLRAHQAALKRQAGQDLSAATTLLYEKMHQDKLDQAAAIMGLHENLGVTKQSTAAALEAAKTDFAGKVDILTNTISANHKEYEEGIEHLTNVAYDWKAASAKDRERIRSEAQAMNADLQKAIVKAIQIGEARAKEVLEQSMASIDTTRRALMIEISAQVENMANVVLATVLEDRSTIANNYLSVKGYAGANQDAIMTYIQKGQGKGLSAIGDFLQTVAIASEVPTTPSLGVSAGLGELIPPFGGKPVPEVTEISKVNGLCDEFYLNLAAVAERWPLGLGKYLLGKMSESMTKAGILTVGSISGRAGQWVYVDGKTLGLEHKMPTFAELAVRSHTYQEFLAKLEAHLPETKVPLPYSVPAPEWQGD